MEEYRLIEVKDKKDNPVYTKVSLHRFEELNKYAWQFMGTGHRKRVYRYATQEEIESGAKKTIAIHRQIMNFPKLQVDHKDGDPLNNTDENLRVATSRQNNYNRTKKRKNTSSKYKGVSLYKDSGKYLAFITFDAKRVSLGLHENEEFAAKVRDLAATRLHGDFGVLNFPDAEPVDFNIDKYIAKAKPVWKKL